VPGILLSKGFKIDQKWDGTPYEDTFKAVCTLTRPDGDKIVSEFSVKDAKDAGLWSPDAKIKKKGRNGTFYDADNDSPWHKYPKRMLWARALGFAAKDIGSDAMKGLMVREEVEDMLRSREAIDLTPDVPALPNDIPEIPEDSDDIPELPMDDDESGLADQAEDDRLSPDQEEAALANLQDELAVASPGTRMEIADMYESVIERMSKAGRARAEAILEGRDG
jgi:hypothetical protein